MTQHVYADNVREGSVSTGTGDFVTTGGIGSVPTVAIGKALSDVLSSGDTFDYIIHHRTSNEWEIGVGTFSGSNTFARTRVIASSNSGSLVNFSAGNKSVWIGPTSEIKDHWADLVNIKTYGATSGGSNTAAINAARTVAGVNTPIVAPSTSGSWGIVQPIMDTITVDTVGNGTGLTFSQGTLAAPSTTTSPIIYLDKIVTAASGSTNHHALIDARFKKIGGTNNTYGMFIGVQDSSPTSGLSSALVNMMQIDNASTSGIKYNNLIYINKTVSNTCTIRGIEIGIEDSSGQDGGWLSAPGSFPASSLLGSRVYTTTARAQIGYHVTGAGTGVGWYTGILIDQDGILPYSYHSNSEGIRIRGASSQGNQYRGMYFQDGYMNIGINFVGPTYDNNCVFLWPKQGKVIYGTANTDGTYQTWTTGNLFNIVGGKYAVEGTQVVGSRATGWSTPTGTATRTAFATSSVTTANLAQAVKALIEDLTTHGLIGS